MNLKINAKHISLIALVMIIAVSGCKSPEAKVEATQDTPLKDTAAIEVAKDTVAKVVVIDSSKLLKPLTLIVTNLASDDGPVIVGVYGPKNNFPDPKDQLKVYKFVPNGKTLTAQIDDIGYGDFALAIYQDVNNNGKIDKNMIGIPTEPYAFSNNYRPKVKAPNYKNCQFCYNRDSNIVAMKMIR